MLNWESMFANALFVTERSSLLQIDSSSMDLLSLLNWAFVQCTSFLYLRVSNRWSPSWTHKEGLTMTESFVGGRSVLWTSTTHSSLSRSHAHHGYWILDDSKPESSRTILIGCQCHYDWRYGRYPRLVSEMHRLIARTDCHHAIHRSSSWTTQSVTSHYTCIWMARLFRFGDVRLWRNRPSKCQEIDLDPLVWEMALLRCYLFNKKWRNLNRMEVGPECWILVFFLWLSSTFSSASSVTCDLDLMPKVPSLWIYPTITSNSNRDERSVLIPMSSLSRLDYTNGRRFSTPWRSSWPTIFNSTCHTLCFGLASVAKFSTNTVKKRLQSVNMLFALVLYSLHVSDILHRVGVRRSIVSWKSRKERISPEQQLDLDRRESMRCVILFSVIIAALIPNIGLVISLGRLKYPHSCTHFVVGFL